ncbi:hypothetical protein D9M71_657520 [compost metagenome]
MLAFEGEVDVAVPHPVLDERLGRHHLFDAGHLDRLFGAVDQGNLALLRRFQALGVLAGGGVMLDQQVLVGFQGGNLVPLEGDIPGIVGAQQQLAAVVQLDLAGQAVTILQPHGIGKSGERERDEDETEQFSQQHEQDSSGSM